MLYSASTEEYNPFVSAERQLMELLQCDDFEPFTPSHTTTTTNTNNKNPIKSADSVERKQQRSSVIEPPSQFNDKLTTLNDNFELIESFINDNFSTFTTVNTNNNRRKYSDDLSSIDPKLINENDDLSIPDHFKSDFSDTDPFSLQYDKNISAFEPIIPKSEIIHDLKRSVSMFQQNNNGKMETATRLHKPKTALPKVNSFRRKQQQSDTIMTKSMGSVVNSSAKGKKTVPVMKRSLSMADPVTKPKNFKNKQEVQDYFNEKKEKNVMKNGKDSPEKEVECICQIKI